MSPRARFSHLLRNTVFGVAMTFATCVGTLDGIQQARGQENPPKPRSMEPRLKEEAAIKEKRKEKDVARAIKTDKFDVAPIEAFYKDYLIPRLTSLNPEVINATRSEIQFDIAAVEGNKDLLKAYNTMLIRYASSLMNRKEYSAATRINAAVLLGRLNSVVTKSGPVPEAAVQGLLINLVDPNELEGLSSSAMSSLRRHLMTLPENTISEANRIALVGKLKAFMEASVPTTRTAEAQDYLKGQIIDCLTLIAKIEPGKEPSKQATEFLSPVLVKLLSEQTSEWLLETVCLSLGTIKPVNLTPEDLAKVEIGIAKFARTSMTSWKKRILMTTAIASGMGASGSSGPGGAGLGFGSAGSVGAGGGDEDKGEGGGGGFGGRGAPGGSSGAGGQARPPRQEKPKEVVNARRIAHQRFERIHFALNGAYGAPKKEQPGVKTPEPSGLFPLLTDEGKKEKVKSLIEKIEAFQSDLNDDKIVDLSTLTMKVGKSSKELRLICVDISGEKKPEEVVDEGSSDPFGNQGP
jgi:hypothetical protein